MSRITGLATGLDVDAVVKETMQAYQSKIDVVEQQKKVAELQQEMYREMITECRDFYSKYFDIGKDGNLLLERNWSNTTFESTNSSVATATSTGSASVDNYDVKVVQLAKPAQKTISSADAANLNKITFTVDDNGTQKPVEIDLSSASTAAEKASLINEKVSEYGISVKYSSFSDGIVISTKETGKNQKLTIDIGAGNEEIVGKDAKVYLTNSNGDTHLYEGSKNSVTLDGVSFKFNSVNATETNSSNKDVNNVTTTTEAKIVGKTDATGIKDTIIKFVNDYNTLMINLNTKISEKRDNSFMPLTDAQRKEMSDKEIELWEKKVKTGQLSRDSDLTRIRNAMKNAMKTALGGVSLESIGITPVSDYSGTKNGTFTIDEKKLTDALENKMDDVKSIFLTKDNKKGALTSLKEIFDKETQSSSGSLIQKAGMEGSATASNNTLTRKINDYEKQLKRMQTLFSQKEQALYSKYASLETMMNNLNAQMSSLSSMFA